MKELATMLHDNGRRALAALRWRYLGRPLAMIAGGILLAIIIVHGESWAIQQAPLLLGNNSIALSPHADCLPRDSVDDGALPVAILH
jgi:hypothetical protein